MDVVFHMIIGLQGMEIEDEREFHHALLLSLSLSLMICFS